MPASMISVENLSKRYLVGHREQRGGQASYTALRDVISQELRNFGRKAGDLMRGRQVVQGDTIEEFWALKDVNFEVREGEVLGIIGRNGAGKSTLLKLLSRITEPTAGRITLRGRVASLLEVGTGFHPELTGRENIYLNGAILGMGRAETRRKFDEIVAFAEVEKFLDTPVKRYSSGMYVRLAFAVAAHLDPEILVIDEVLAVGDAEFQKKCLSKMGEFSHQGRTVLFVSHNMAAVRTLCTKALLLEAGVVTASGPVYDAIGLYLRQNCQRSQDWIRPLSLGTSDVSFERLGVSYAESASKLTCTMEIRVRAPRAASMVAVDVQNALGSSIMQALPSLAPFLPGQPGRYKVTVEISLPPLIPGTFWLMFWIGPHNNETYDEIPGALSFDVFDSPTPGRTFPHTVEHGYIVPPSACKLESQSDAGILETARS
jgi:ABC-type polysaccharide/polyol phosphate transport system ATPase subunit